MGNEDVQQLLRQVRQAVGGGVPTPVVMELLDRLEPAVGELVRECASQRSRLERPLTGPRHEEPARLEAWVRKLEQPETTTQ
jgi:hypothetical protein